ncbi:MAG: type II secretion system protein [Desulfuromonadales bacterium]|nr:type II secretion system protein [Desulfuromonadales bacterium]MDW7758791.1 type II secretion system protein [Desulfuromonadales bacterium]
MMTATTTRRQGEKGFTLVELVTVIVLVGILGAMSVAFITKPIEGYVALSRRAELVDAADNALRRMQHDIRQALPNSVHIGAGGLSLELLHTSDGGRYRLQGPGDTLNFGDATDSSFDVLGGLRTAPPAGSDLVIYNLSASGITGNAYQSPADNRFAIDSTASSAAHLHFLPKVPPVAFPRSSPYQRFFIVDGPVSYVCDPTAGTLTRHDGYAIAPSPVLGSGDLVTRQVKSCNFTYQPGTSQRAGLVTMTLTLEDAPSAERVTLLHQVHVLNSP